MYPNDHSQPRQKKALSQVFLTVEWPAQRTIEQLKLWGVRHVLEVGPGAGALTLPLVRAGFKVTALERDERFVEFLVAQPELAQGSFEVIHTDVLKFDLKAWLTAQSHEPCAVVGNIPYHISSPIIEWVLPSVPNLKGAVFLTQFEFARRIAAPAGNKDYGSLSVYVQLRSKTHLLAKVDKELFKPQPKVDSALIALSPLEDMLSPDLLRKVEKVCRATFAQRRKQMLNTLKAFLGERIKEPGPIDLRLRPEVLTPEQFVDLARHVFSE